MWRKIAVVVMLGCGAIWCARAFALAQTSPQPTAAPAAEINLAVNGDLSRGSGATPADWYGLSSNRKVSHFTWSKTPEGGVLEIDNPTPNYASWHQALMLAPGIYRISVEARVEGTDRAKGGGASIAVQTFDGIRLISQHIHGDSPAWREVSLLLNEDKWGDTSELLLQLGIMGYPDTGKASFRNVKVVRLATVPSGKGQKAYDLAAIRDLYKKITILDQGGYSRAVGAVCGLALLALLGWALAAIWRPALEARRWQYALAAMLAITALKLAALFHFTGFYWDIWAKTNRALLAVALGPAHIYDPGLPVDAYPPGSIYLLWLAGWMGRLLEPSAEGFRVMVETPPLIADLLLGFTFYCATWRSGREWRAAIVMMLFALNPGLLFDTVIWGQSDSVVTLPMLAAAILILAGRNRLGWCAAAIAILAKPQSVTIMPLLGLWTLLNGGIVESGWSAATFIGTLVLGILPYQIGHEWNWIVQVYETFGTRFGEASVGAFNFMGLLGGMGTADSERVVGGITYNALGVSLTIVAYAIATYLMWRAHVAASSRSRAMLALVVAMLGLFLFAPRMHERYLYYPLAFLVPLALEAPTLTAVFAVLSGTMLFNQAYIKHLSDTSTFFPDHPNAALIVTALLNVAAFVALVAYGLLSRQSQSPAGTAGDVADAATISETSAPSR